MENKKHTVLVVEDDHHLRALTLEILADEGYTVAEARNGHEAVAMITAGLRPDLIVLDLCLPIMSGPELIEWLRAQKTVCAVPVLVVTCRGQVVAPFRREVQGWLSKPCSPAELVAAIDQLRTAAATTRATRRRAGGGSSKTLRAAV